MSPRKMEPHGDPELRRRAEEQLRLKAPGHAEVDPRRLVHELQVHQIQLEMQNAELHETQTRLETLVEKYSDLYDFSPVGYFSVDAAARIQEVNLTGAAMLGIDRSHLLRQLLSGFVAPSHRLAFSVFLKKIFAGSDKQVCELPLANGTGGALWVDLQGICTSSPKAKEPLCRLAISDITALKRAAEAQSRVEAMQSLNEALEAEICSRISTETSLRESKRQQGRLLKEARRMQEQLRTLSHQILHVQEEERKRISVDLHDEIAQTLVAINVHLACLARDSAAVNSRFGTRIIETQKLVEQSVESVHRFAMGLRPTVLDDLGLIPALRAYAKEFSKQTRLPVHFAAAGGFKPLGDAPTVALYRVAQAALSNVARHAEAKTVQLTLRQTQQFLRLEVTDDGKGFDSKSTKTGNKSDRLGMIGMQERAEMVGGRLRVSSSPGKGTTISMTLPLAKAYPPSTST